MERMKFSPEGGNGMSDICSKAQLTSNSFHKPAERLRFGKEETGSEDKRLRAQRGLVPSRPFPTHLRRPNLFSLRGKRLGRKGRWDAVGAFCGYVFGKHQLLSPYEHYGTRRLLRNNKFASSCL